VKLLRFSLEPLLPFRLDLTVWALRRSPDNTIDQWDGRVYRRVLVVEDMPLAVGVTHGGAADDSRLWVEVAGERLPDGTQAAVTAAIDRLLGLHVDLIGFYQLASGDVRLGPLAERFRGLKPPRFVSIFETLVNAIACQQITLTVGIRLLDRLADAYGPAAETALGLAHALPAPDVLAGLDQAALRVLGFSRQKAQALLMLAGALATGTLELESLAAEDDEAAVARLRQLHGVGRWTAEYVLLRGLGRLHVFPGDDVGARNNLKRWLDRAEPLDYVGVRQALAPWVPYDGLIYLHLLLDHLASTGVATAAKRAAARASRELT
jgi:DNA-3-methyladenine glycosylase II